MFPDLQKSATRSKGAWLSSALIHCAILAVLIGSGGPVFIKPSSVAFGNHDSSSSQSITYLANSGENQLMGSALEAPSRKTPRKPKPAKAKKEKKERIPAAEAPAEVSRAGSSYGSMSAISMSGYEARPAFPINFPDPPRSEMPEGRSGDVVIEVTIDTQGNVADTKILESLGDGIDDRVVATVRNWRFTPATVNGVAIASRQDVHFHFPS